MGPQLVSACLLGLRTALYLGQQQLMVLLPSSMRPLTLETWRMCAGGVCEVG